MTDALKTYTVSIPSVALARMVWQRADRTAFPQDHPDSWQWYEPLPREDLQGEPEMWPASAEYYRIIDRISRGEAP